MIRRKNTKNTASPTPMDAGPKAISKQFYGLFDLAPDAMLAVDRDGRIVVANAQVGKVFGYSREELIGQSVEILMPERFRAGHLEHCANYFTAPRTRSMGSGLELYARRKNGAEIPVELSLSPLETGEGLWAIGAIRDISERKQAEKKDQLIHEITKTIAEAKDFNSALEETLRKVCEATGWVCGEAWIFNPCRKVLECAPVWYSSVPELEKFKGLSRDFTFAPGVGLPGRVWLSKKPAWVVDVTEDANFSRKEIARKAGLKSAVGIPILAGSEAVAVLDFFLPAIRPADRRTLALVRTVAAQLGRLFWHKQAEQELQVRYQHLQALHETSQTVLSSLDLQLILDTILDKALAVSGLELGNIRLVNKDRQTIEVVSSRGYRVGSIQSLYHSLIDTTRARFSRRVLESKKTMVVENISSVEGLASLKREGVRSAIVIPVRVQEEILGVIQLGSRSPRRFEPGDIQTLEALGSLMGLAVEKARLHEEALSKARDLQALCSIASVINQSLDVEDILRRAMHKILEVFGFDAARVRLLSEEGRSWGFLIDEGLEDMPVPAPQWTPEGVNAGILKTGKPVFFEDIQNDAEYERLSRAKTSRRFGFRGSFRFPIKVKDKTIGVMGFLSIRPRRFSSSEVEMVHAIADQVGTAVENARLHECTLLQMKRLRALHEIDLAITSTLRLRSVLGLLLDKVALFLPNSASIVRLYVNETQKLEFAACHNIDEETWKAHTTALKRGIGLNSIMLKTRAPVVVSSIKKDKRVAHRDFLLGQGLVSFLGIPLIARDEFLGVLGLYTREEHEWSDDEVEFFTLLGAEAAIAVYNAKLYEEVSRGRTELRVLSHRLLKVQEDERRRLARELHDEIGQELTALMVKLGMRESEAEDGERKHLAAVRLVVEDLIKRVRDLSLDLRPLMLDDLGLVPALFWQFERFRVRTGVRVDFRHRGVKRRFNLNLETAVFRIIQEALTNVVRHAGVEKANVRVYANRKMLCVRVEDHGKGFDPSRVLVSGLSGGISGMQERARLLRGQLVLESQVGRGTSIFMELPLGKARRKRRGR